MEALRTSSNDSPRLRFTREKIRSFAHRPLGWHYGQGEPARPETVILALRLLDYAAGQGLARTNAFYGADGSISLTLYHGDRYMELNFGAGDRIEYVEEEEGEEVGYEEGLTVTEAKERIRDFKETVWASSGLLTSQTGIMNVASLTTGPLQAFARVASLSLTMIALPGIAAESAPTLHASTRECRETLPPTGTSLTDSSPAIVDTRGSRATPVTDVTAT